MKHEDKDYEKWLSAVKSRQPVLENPNELTDLILKRVSRIRNREKFWLAHGCQAWRQPYCCVCLSMKRLLLHPLIR